MFNWKQFQITKSIFSQHKSYQDLVGQHHVFIRPVDLLRWFELSNDDLGFFTLVEIAGADLRENSSTVYEFELVYCLLNMGTHQRLNIHVLFDENEIIPSLVSLFLNADWLEREQKEALGIKFNRPMNELLLPRNQTNYPLRKNASLENWPLNLSDTLPKIKTNPNKSEAPYPEESFEWKSYPLYSSMNAGLFESMVCFDPHKVHDIKLDIGHNHQGFEKLLENKDWQQALQLVDRIHLGAAPTYGIAWAKNLEDLLRVKLPERAQAIRIVALELARISEHLTVMTEMIYSLKFEEYKFIINAREKLYELMEKFCGRRQGLSIARFGGIKEDLPHGWIIEYQSASTIVMKVLRSIHRSLCSQASFKNSLSGGVVSAQTALQWGISGPTMRASGLNFDLRKSQPFYFYQDIDFDVPVGINGTAYERYLIRYEEIFQSFRIITQVIDNLPLGEVMNPEYDLDFVGVKELLGNISFPNQWHYTGLESPNGEAGFLVKFTNSFFAERIKIKTPSLSLAQALPHLLYGIEAKDLQANLASVGIRPYELDR